MFSQVSTVPSQNRITKVHQKCWENIGILCYSRIGYDTSKFRDLRGPQKRGGTEKAKEVSRVDVGGRETGRREKRVQKTSRSTILDWGGEGNFIGIDSGEGR